MRPAPLAGLGGLRHIGGACPSFPKSRPPSAAWSACWTAGASRASRRGGRICAGRFRVDLGQRLTGCAGHRASAPRQIWADRHRSRRHAGLPSRHVGPLAGRPERDSASTTISSSRPTRGGGVALNDARRFGSLDLVRDRRARRLAAVQGAWARAVRPRRARAQAAAGRPHRARSSCCCSTSGSSPGSATSMCARRCTAPASTRKRAGGSISLERLQRLVPAIHDVLAEAIAAGGSTLARFRQPRRRARLFLEELRGLRPRRASRAPAAGRSSGSSRAAARPSIARDASVDLQRHLSVGERALRCEPLGRAVFH